MMTYLIISTLLPIIRDSTLADKLIKFNHSTTLSSLLHNPIHMYHAYLFSVAIIILTFVAWYDLKTSLIWDLFPLLLFILSLIAHLTITLYTHNWFYIWYPSTIGAFFLFLGELFYYAGQWGEGDVYVLSSLMFAIPFKLYFFNFSHLYKVFGSPYYIVIFFINLAIFGAIYSLLYTIVYALIRKKDFFHIYIKELLKGIKYAIAIECLNLLFFLTIYIWKGRAPLSLFIYSSIFLISFYALFVFSKLADTHLFTLYLPLCKVKEGDTVIGKFAKAGYEGKLLDAITKEQLQKLKEVYGPNKKVIVKDMVRYAPAFLITLLITALIGDKVIVLLLHYI